MERDTVIKHQAIMYHGPFSVADLYKFIDDWLDEHRYDRRDTDHNEAVKPDGKYIEVSLRPWYSISDYSKFTVWIDLKMSQIKDIEIEVDGLKRTMQEGEVWIGVKAYFDMDTEGRWEGNPLHQIIRTAFNRYIYKENMEHQIDELKAQVIEFKEQLKAFLNLYKKRSI